MTVTREKGEGRKENGKARDLLLPSPFSLVPFSLSLVGDGVRG
jgi:hypothetical protein